MKRAAVSFLLLLCVGAVYAQKAANPHSKQVTDQANRMAKALMAKDLNTFSTYVLPAVMKAAGGKDAMIKGMKKSMADMAKSGQGFIAMRIETPSALIDTAGTLQCTLPETVRMKTDQGIVDNHTTLLAVSLDKGKTWKFVDLAGPDALLQLRGMMPSISKRHVVPAAKMEIANG